MSARAQAVRQQIETRLAPHMQSALTPRSRFAHERMACGIPALNEYLGGGIPIGAITELVGPECSGRTTAALGIAGHATRTGAVCAWVDVADTFDPESAAANGICLERLLWTRCGVQESAESQPVQKRVAADPVALAATPVSRHGGGSPHPRSEGRDMPQALAQMFAPQGRTAGFTSTKKDKSIGTPGVVNRRLGEREEQVATDRLPPRRGENVVRSFEPRRPTPRPDFGAVSDGIHHPRPARTPWTALDNALRVTDLLLQAGGFSIIVLDLGSTPPEQAWRVPLSSWFRFRTACEHTRTGLIVLTQHPCARSSAELVVRMRGSTVDADGQVIRAVTYHAEIDRQRVVQPQNNIVPIRKPPQSVTGTRWTGKAAWASR